MTEKRKKAKRPAGARTSRPVRAVTLGDQRSVPPPPRPRKRRPSKAARRAWTVLNGIAIAGALSVVALVIAIGVLAAGLPSSDEYLAMKGTPSVTFLDAEGRLLARRGSGQGAWVTREELPPQLVLAVLATEDRRFYDHWGIDVTAIARAALANVVAGRVVQGGSTITQQLAKMLFLESDRTLWRKAQEVMLALYLEMRFTKDEILTMYLNRAYFGAGAFGVDAASRRYFSKPAHDVTLTEAAVLAGLLKAPSRYSPINGFDAAEERARVVLESMVEAGFIDEAKRAVAAATRPKIARAVASADINYVIDWLMEDVTDHIGGFNADLVVETTIDAEMQQAAEAAVATVLDRESFARNIGEAGFVAMDNAGAVRAMVGGRSYGISQFNHAVQARRQPGSTFKPFVYLAALEAGRDPRSTITDAPIVVGGWAPSNFNDEYEGQVTLTYALSRSLNSAAVRLALEVGPRAVARVARRMGITSPLEANASLALGTSEVRLIELAGAYVPFANGGDLVTPHGIARIRSRDGRILYERETPVMGLAVTPHRAAQMNAMMAATLREGTARNAYLEGRQAAGKTGTSQNFRDAWFVGYVNGLTAAAWLGNDDGAPMHRVTGGALPAEIWKRFMDVALAKVPAQPLPGADIIDDAPAFEVAGAATAEGTGASDEATVFDDLLDSLFGDEEPAAGPAAEPEAETPRRAPPVPHRKR